MTETKINNTKVSHIVSYPSNLEIWDNHSFCYQIYLDGLYGEFTREEWEDTDYVIQMFNAESRKKILDTLENMQVFK
jgi:hypothetical protein